MYINYNETNQEIELKARKSQEATEPHKEDSFLPYWYLISRVLNFAILARQYFAGFYFRDFNRQIWKKGIKFRDRNVLNFILFFQRSELFKVSR